MGPILLCLDSGTTSLKAAAFDGQGRLIARAERPNGALHRDGLRVEQDMDLTRSEALAVLRDCAGQLDGQAAADLAGLVITGQGDGLWPVDAAGRPVGRALTWLDGRARALAADMAPALDMVQAATGSRPTAASATLQLLWMQRNDPARHERIALALRLKEWLFLSLTGRALAEPSVVLTVWGNWRNGALSQAVPESLGLSRGLELLPEQLPVGEAQAGLSREAAQATGLPQGLPVLLGPGDAQSTLIGLGLGSRKGVACASIFGTSAIHACLRDDPDMMPQTPAGAMIQQFVLGPGYLCLHPSFNGAALLQHLSRRFAGLPAAPAPEYSGLVLHPFLETGGERAPWTDPHASGALFGLGADATPGQIAWAGREALAFVTRASHAMMGGPDGALSLGGGLAEDGPFAQFLATSTGRTVQRSPGSHAGLRGLAAIGARYLLDAADTLAWTGDPEESLAPASGPVARYAERKYHLFEALLDASAPFWASLSSLRTEAERLRETS